MIRAIAPLPTLVLALLLSACAGVSVREEPAPEQPAAARLYDQGDYAGAARAYTAAATAARGAERNAYLVRAAEAWRADGDGARARTVLEEVNPRRLGGDDALRYDLLQAGFALDAKQNEQALSFLEQAPKAAPDALRARWHTLRAAAYAAGGDVFAAAGERAALDPLLADAERPGNAREIERLLAGLDDPTLAQRSAELPAGDPLYAYAGRALTRRGLPLPRPYERGEGWTPASDRPPAEADGYRPPRQLAVLLPLSGPLSQAGASVRDGLLAAYYSENRRRPTLRFYDTADGSDARSDYAQALGDGADFVVGPLAREDVSALFESNATSTPLLALNRVTTPPPPGSASFSLAPEDEGAAAADRLLGRGVKRVIAIIGSDENARRGLTAFRARLIERGGEIVAEAAVFDGNPDYGPVLSQAVAHAGGTYDAVFLALKAGEARLLVPQLAVAGISGVPLISTSQILLGSGNPRLDRELDGIEYPELPWLIRNRPDLPDAAIVGTQLGSARGAAGRLFAFGLDAWRLAAYLEHLALDPSAYVNGATGALRLDGFGNIVRTPDWAVFSGGRPRPAPDGGLRFEAPGADGAFQP